MHPVNFSPLSLALTSKQAVEILESYDDSFAKIIPSSSDSKFSLLVLKEYQVLCSEAEGSPFPEDGLFWAKEHFGKNPNFRMAAVAHVLQRLLYRATLEPLPRPAPRPLSPPGGESYEMSRLRMEAKSLRDRVYTLESAAVSKAAPFYPSGFFP